MSQTPRPIRGMSIDKNHPLARGLVGYWPLLEGTGEMLHDYSGSGNHGELQNTVPSDWSMDIVGPALNFDTDGDHARISSDIGFAANDGWTIQAAVDFRGDSYHNMFGGGNASRFYWFVDGTYTLRAEDATNPVFNQSVGTPPGRVLVTATHDGDGNYVIYHDAQPVVSVSSTAKPFTWRFLGANEAGAFTWLGKYAAPAIYDRALSAVDVAAVYADQWGLFRRRVVAPSEPPPAYDIQGSNVHGVSSISFGWTVNPA